MPARSRTPHTSRFTKIVLAVGALTTIATSAVHDPEIVDTARSQLTPGTPVHVVVVANRDVTDEAETLLVTLSVSGGAGTTQLRFVPDDPTLAPQTFMTGAASASWAFLAGSDPDPAAGQFACPPDAACELGVTVEVVSDDLSPRELVVDVSATSEADSSLCFPDDASFPETAAFEIRFDAVP